MIKLSDFEKKKKKEEENQIGMIKLSDFERQDNSSSDMIKLKDFERQNNITSSVLEEKKQEEKKETKEDIKQNKAENDNSERITQLSSEIKRLSSIMNPTDSEKKKLEQYASELKELTNINTSPKVTLSSSEELTGAKDIRELQSELKAKEEAKEINEAVENKDYSKLAGYYLNNFSGSVIGGFGQIGEAATNVGAGIVGGVSNILPEGELKEKTQDLKNDLLEESKRIDTQANYRNKVVNNIDNGLLRTSGQVENTVGEMVPSIVSNVVAPGSGIFVSAAQEAGSSSTENLDYKNSNLGRSLLTGAGKGAIAGLSEKIIGGDFISEGALDKLAAKGISKLTANKVAQNVLYKIYQNVGEQAEEILEDEVGDLIDAIINKQDIPSLKEKLSRAGETAKVTALSTIVLNALGLGGGNIDETLYDGRTKNEQKLYESLVEQETKSLKTEKAVNKMIEEQTETFKNIYGRELTESEIKEITDKINKVKENGKLDLDNTELSKQEIKDIEAEIKKDLEDGNIDVNTIVDILGEDIYTDNDPLIQKSMYEYAQKYSNYQAELTGDEKVDRMLQSAVESGLNNTSKTRKMVEIISKLTENTDRQYRFVSQEQLKEMGYNENANGLTDKKTGEILLSVNSNKQIEAVVGHETTHLFDSKVNGEYTQEYKDLQKSVVDFLKTNGTYEAKIKEIMDTYTNAGINLNQEQLMEELTADTIGDNLFGENAEEFVKQLTTNKNVFQKIYDYIKKAVRNLRGYDTEEARALQNLKDTFDKVYKTLGTETDNDTDIKYSIQQNEQGQKYVKVDTDQNIFEGIDKKDYNKIAKMYIHDYLIGKTQLSENDTAIIDRKSANKYTNPGKKQQNFDKKMQLTPELKNVLEIAQIDEKSEPSKTNSKYKSWEYYKFNFELSNKLFEGTINIGIDSKGNKHFYEINKIKEINDISETSLNRSNISANNSIPSSSKEVNTTVKYSIQNNENNAQDNQGRSLSKEQQDYFKDSKARNNNNELVTVYHTTTDKVAQFNEFNPIGTSYYRFGDQVVNYYTDSKDMSGSYADNQYKMADTRKINNMQDFNSQLNEINEDIKDFYNIELKQKGDGSYTATINYNYSEDKSFGVIDKEIKKLKQFDFNLYNELLKRAKDNENPYNMFSGLRNDAVDEFLYEVTSKDPKAYTAGETARLVKQYLTSSNLGEINFTNQEDLFRNFKVKLQKEFPRVARITNIQYEGYVNITNPYIIDAEERNWNRVVEKSNDFIDDLVERVPEETKNNLIKLYNESHNISNELIDKQQEFRQDFMSIKNPIIFSTDTKAMSELIEAVGIDTINNIYNGKTDYIPNYKWWTISEILKDSDIVGETTSQLIHDEYKLPENVKKWLNTEFVKKLDLENAASLKELYEKYEDIKNEINKYPMPYSYFIEQISNGEIELGTELEDIFETRAEIIGAEEVAKELAKAASAGFSKPEMIRLWGTSKTTNDVVKEIIASNKDGKTNYDGIIIKNVYDYGGRSNTKEPANLYVTFNSNQFKALDNKAPTVDSDIRYSMGTSEEMQDTDKNNKVLDGYTRLYRGMSQERDTAYNKNKLDNLNGYESWTDNYNLAKEYGDNVYYIDIPTSEIKNSIIDEDSTSETYGDRNLIYRNDKPVGINSKSGTEYMLYTDHDNYKNIKYNKIENIDPDIRYSMTEDNKERYWKKLNLEDEVGKWNERTSNKNNEIEMEESSNQGSFNLDEEVGSYRTENNTNEMTEQQPRGMKDKAKKYISRSKTNFINNIVESFGTSKIANTNTLNDVTERIKQDIFENGKLTKEQKDNYFNELYDGLKKIDTDFYDTYKDLKNDIRNTRLYVSDNVRGDITDFDNFRKSNIRNIIMTNDRNNIPVDTYYKELSDLYPELFSNDIVIPSEQLIRIADVSKDITKVETNVAAYNDEHLGKDYRNWARETFDRDIDKFVKDIKLAQRYNEETPQDNTIGMTKELVKEAYNKLPEARRKYEKANAKEVLTKEDRVQVDRLLNNEISIQDIPDGLNKEGIIRLATAKAEYDTLQKSISEYQLNIRQNRIEEAKADLGNLDLWKDKNIGFKYSRETPIRNIYDVAPKSIADTILDKYFRPYIETNEKKVIEETNRYFDRVRALNLSDKKEYKVTIDNGEERVSESSLVQLLGEKKITTEQIKEVGADVKKIENAVKEFRAMYNEMFENINESMLDNGYAPVEFRKDYFPHFTEQEPDSILGKAAKLIGIDITERTELPTDISGQTYKFRPGRTWFGNLLQRTTDVTNYDAKKGFEKYVKGAMDLIYHTGDIQNQRALYSAITTAYNDAEIQNQVTDIKENNNFTDLEKAVEIQKIYDTAKDRSHLSKFAEWLNNYTNLLAGKKSINDRGAEKELNRKVYQTMTDIESRIAANAIGGNVGVSLTNFAPLAQAMGEVKTHNLINGMWQTMKASLKHDNSFASESQFITRRRGIDTLTKSTLEKITKPINSVLEFADNFTSEAIVRAKYIQNLQEGMNAEQALEEADRYTAGLMADRGRGALPTEFSNKNPIAKMINMFQVEVNNQWSYYIKDLPRNLQAKANNNKESITTDLAMSYTKIMVGSYLINELLGRIRGNSTRVLPDPIYIMKELINGLSDDDDDNDDDAIIQAFTEVAGNVPFIALPATLLADSLGLDVGEIGRIPISGAVPNITDILSTLMDNNKTTGEKAKNIAQELADTIGASLILPYGGSQLKKTVKGMSLYNNEIPGSYTEKGDLRYTVDEDLGSKVQAGLFGAWANPYAQDYIDSGYKTISAKNIDEMVGLEMNSTEYRGFKSELNKVGKTTDKNGYKEYTNADNETFWYDSDNEVMYDDNYKETNLTADDLIKVSKTEEKLNYINASDLTDAQKDLVANNLNSNSKKTIDMTEYGNYDSYDEYKYARDYPEQYSVISQITNYNEYMKYKNEIEDLKEMYSTENGYNSKQRKNAIQEYIQNLDLNVYQKIMLEHMAGGYSIKNYASIIQEYLDSTDLDQQTKYYIWKELFE